MAHKEQMDFVNNVKMSNIDLFNNVKVLEIGSYNINGSVRQFFTNSSYIGLDVFPGNCVDVVCSGHLYEGQNEEFDVTISCECFEHNQHWLETFENMYRMTKKDGLVVFTCATTGRPEHGTARTSPQDSLTTNILTMQDYYRNLQEVDFTSSFDFSKFSSYKFEVNTQTKDLYFWGIK